MFWWDIQLHSTLFRITVLGQGLRAILKRCCEVVGNTQFICYIYDNYMEPTEIIKEEIGSSTQPVQKSMHWSLCTLVFFITVVIHLFYFFGAGLCANLSTAEFVDWDCVVAYISCFISLVVSIRITMYLITPITRKRRLIAFVMYICANIGIYFILYFIWNIFSIFFS